MDCLVILSMQEIKIGNRVIGNKHPIYIIAEIGLNHQGDVNLAKKLIDKAIEARCDAVKFQKRSIKKIYKKDVLENKEKQEHSIHYLLQHIEKAELSDQEILELHKYSLSRGIEFLCTPWDEDSLLLLETLHLPAYKIASADMFNLKLIQTAASYKKPLLISTGMSYLSEIEQLVSFLKGIQAEFVLLHCNSTYPAPYYDINLNFMTTLRKKFDCLIGYSGHERGISVSIAAAVLGARIIEKHLTLDKTLPGPDHKASLEPEEFEQLVTQIRIVETALGHSVRYPSRGEYLNREALSKSLVAARNLKKGTIIHFDDIDIKSPGKGTSPLKLHLFEGKKLIRRDILKDDYLLESDIGLIQSLRDLQIRLNHKWGLVGRISDLHTLLHCKPDFVEIHLTDTDILLKIQQHRKFNVDLVVHGPEYYDDLLLDLSSLDKDVRYKSIDFFDKALHHARKIKILFNNANQKVKFVVHPGGMSMNKPIANREQLYKNLNESLNKLNSQGFELLIENMPSCPWYFGGQWYHASFMDAQEIVDFSTKTGFGITFDISHGALYCNYYRKKLEQLTKIILPVTKYIHISDAANFNGEGLQIGQGTIDFSKILPYFAKTDMWILSEIWQGHKFGGDGFVQAIRSLKSIYPDL